MNFVLLLHNIEKSTNLGQMIRTANALGTTEICVVGKKKFSSYGNKKTQSTTKFRHFYKFVDARDYYQQEEYDVVGVEITEQSLSINEHTFTKSTVFVLGNEGIGINDNALALCDYCVYIPQFGTGASLNVNVASGIVLNAFVSSCGFTHNKIVHKKFVKADS